MRISLQLAIILFLIYACSAKKQTVPLQVLKVYNPEDFITKVIPEKEFKVIDTFCINETQRAEKDIKKGKLFLHDSYLDYHNTYLVKSYFFGDPKKSVIQELSKFNILIDTTYIPDLYDIYGEASKYFRNNCYQQIMEIETQSLLAKHSLSIDTLIKRAERQYIINHPNQIYTQVDSDRSFETPSEYQLFISKTSNEFESFIYPKGYKPKNESYYSYTTADFVLMKDGTIKNLKVEATFQNPYNEKFRQYFEKELRDFVLATKWVHPKYSGLIVNCEMSFTFHHR